MKKELQKTLQSLFLFVLLSVTAISYSQIGSLDTSFDPDEGPDFQVNAALPLSDGKIMIAGLFTEYNTVSRKGVARINADGTLDTAFNPGTGIPVVLGSTVIGINDLKIQPDGKILIAGVFETYNDIAKRNMARLNADGSLDNSFTLDPKVVNTIRTITLQPDGKIIITGNFNVDGTRKGVARLNADGSLDETFTSYLSGAGNNAFEFFCALLQPDGKILVGGSFPTSATTFLKLTRLNTDGSRDTSFTPVIHTSGMPINTQGAINSLAMQPDGKIIAGGGFSQLFGSVTKINFVRLNANGTLDTSFSTGSALGVSIISRVNAIELQPDGKMIIAGGFNVYNGTSRKGIARINANGTLDTSFATGTGLVITSVQTMNLTEDGSVIVAGNFNSYNDITRNRIAKISTRTINVTSLSEAGPFCVGASFNVNYTPVGIYNLGNIFTAQLSDSSGSFTSPTNIGTFTSSVAGTVNVTIPQNMPAGTSYKIRIISTSPVVTGDIHTASIVVNVTAVPTATLIQDFTTGQTLADFSITGQNIKWYDSPSGGNELPSSQLIVAGMSYYASQTINGCESPTRCKIIAGIDLSTDTFERNKLQYYPNPVDAILNLRFSETINSITVYNLLGQQVLRSNPNRNEAKIDISSLISGTYIMKVISGSNSKTVKIIKK